VTGPGEARTLVAGIPDARLAVVPGAAHLAPVEQPGAVTDLLVRHFSTAWQETLAAVPVPARRVRRRRTPARASRRRPCTCRSPGRARARRGAGGRPGGPTRTTRA